MALSPFSAILSVPVRGICQDKCTPNSIRGSNFWNIESVPCRGERKRGKTYALAGDGKQCVRYGFNFACPVLAVTTWFVHLHINSPNFFSDVTESCWIIKKAQKVSVCCCRFVLLFYFVSRELIAIGTCVYVCILLFVFEFIAVEKSIFISLLLRCGCELVRHNKSP